MNWELMIGLCERSMRPSGGDEGKSDRNEHFAEDGELEEPRLGVRGDIATCQKGENWQNVSKRLDNQQNLTGANGILNFGQFIWFDWVQSHALKLKDFPKAW